MEDFKRLEYLILQWHLEKGLKLFGHQEEADPQWTFKTVIDSEYKRKVLRVISIIDRKAEQVFYADEIDIIKVIEKANEFFTKGNKDDK